MLKKKKNKNVYLGLDLSLNHAGITALDDEQNIIFMYYQELTNKESKLGMLNRMTLMSKYIIANTIKRLNKVEYSKIYLCSERPLYKSRFTNTLTQLAGIYYVVLVHLVEYLTSKKDVTHKEVSPSQVKKIATGSGNAKKDELYAVAPAAVKEYSMEVKDKDHLDVSDSYWLAITGFKLVNKEAE